MPVECSYESIYSFYRIITLILFSPHFQGQCDLKYFAVFSSSFLATDYSVASFQLLDFIEFSKRTPFDVFMIIFWIEWFLKVWLCLFHNQARIFLFQVFHFQGGWFSNRSSWISQDHALMQFPEVSCTPNCCADVPGCNVFGIS